MKAFHISDVLSITTGRLVSSRHMEGVYDILNYMTDDNLFTHQLPRASRECEPVLKKQFPQLFPDDPLMVGLLEELDNNLKGIPKDGCNAVCARWVEAVTKAYDLPEYLVIMSAIAEKEHEKIDPLTELENMVGKDKVILANI